MGLAADGIFHSILIDHTVNGNVKCVDIGLVVGVRFVRFDNNPIRFVDCGEVFYIFLKVNSCGNVFDLITMNKIFSKLRSCSSYGVFAI